MSDKIVIITYKETEKNSPVNMIDYTDNSDLTCKIQIFAEVGKAGFVEVAFKDLGNRFKSNSYKDFDRLALLRDKLTARIADFLNREIIDMRVVPLIIAECEAEIFGD